MGTRRKAIRQTVVGILSNFGSAPFPTLAGANVFDSKGDDLQNTSDDKQMPAIMVYTDNEVGRIATRMNDWPLEFTLEVVIELALAADNLNLEIDNQLEARLDDLEQQVRDTLFSSMINGKANDHAIRFRRTYAKLDSYKSLRMGNSQNNNRLAMRGIVVEIAYNETSSCMDPLKAFPELKTFGMAFDNNGITTPAVVTV